MRLRPRRGIGAEREGHRRRDRRGRVLVIVGVAAVVMTLKTDVGERPHGDPQAVRRVGRADVDVPSGPETGVEAPTLENQAWTWASRSATATSSSSSPASTGARRRRPGVPRSAEGGRGRVRLRQHAVTNVGTEPQTFFASFNILSDGNTEFASDDEAWIYLGNTLADLNPGDSIDTAVVFDVPVGTDPEFIELHDGPFSEGVTVGL